MNRSKLKSYAPQARRDFIRAVMDRAAQFGLERDKTEPIVEKGDVAIIAGKPFPRLVAAKRKRLEAEIARRGFDQFMEAMAYTWFNRLMAIRFMELHGYLDHGYRVLSPAPSANGQGEGQNGAAVPEIVEHAEHVDLPGLDKQKVVELKLDGTKDAELYRMLLVAQCNGLHAAMPFLFERIDDETELLLPDNLLHSDSLVRKMVREIDEEDWQEVEIIGWLYQFYISERKDEVIGKVVKSEDIPAATQLFTPNWIVKYLVQNSLGRQWLATYPSSPLRQKMEYYIEPAEQTPEVQEQLKAITLTSLNPEELRLLDPACGSGHILVEAYDVLKAIYQERGYRTKDIPRLILEKNLFGLEICDRAAQLAAFSLMMKARADDRRIFGIGVQPQVLAVQESKGLDAREITEALNAPIFKGELPPSESLFEEIDEEKSPLFARKNLGETGGIPQSDVAQLIGLFEHGKSFGSLIRVPDTLAHKLPAIAQRIEDVLKHGRMFERSAAKSLRPLLEQAEVLTATFDALVTNPPYMGRKYMNPLLRDYASKANPDCDSDLFAIFTERALHAVRPHGYMGLMTPFVWMFLSSYEHLRKAIICSNSLTSLIRPEYHAFFDSAYVPVCAFVARKSPLRFRGTFIDLSQFYGEAEQPIRALAAIGSAGCSYRYLATAADFESIPGAPLAYWASSAIRRVFETYKSVGDVAEVKAGLSTGDNTIFQRNWYEVPIQRIGFGFTELSQTKQRSLRWYPCNSGGKFRKWYGNNDTVVDWENDGERIRSFRDERGKLKSAVRNEGFYFREGATWSKISTGLFGARYSPPGHLFDDTGRMVFSEPSTVKKVLALFCSAIARELLPILAPSLSFTSREVGSLPFSEDIDGQIEVQAEAAIAIAKEDWDSSETSWGFRKSPLLGCRQSMIGDSVQHWVERCTQAINRMREIEEANNRLFISIFGLGGEVNAEVPDDQITLYRPDQEEDIKRLVSCAVGCMMGRYSLDEPGIIYAHGGNEGFDPSQYKTFPADQDGIVPLTETDWFPDDAANRVVEFIAVAWPKEHLEENLKFVADSLGPNQGEHPRDTIRRYLATGFFKHHLQVYKRRPIYWLFSSGKQRAFQCLVYLHRYHEGTLSRMRTEYVIPLQGKISARIDQLAGDSAKATSTSHRKKLDKEKDKLVKQQAELVLFDEKLRHYADQRISLDLDDGVKVNYGKFGDLLAEVRAVTGGGEEE